MSFGFIYCPTHNFSGTTICFHSVFASYKDKYVVIILVWFTYH